MRRSVLLLLALSFAVSGCAATTTVRGQVVLSARLPVRTYPAVVVAGGDTDHEALLADRLTAHLELRYPGEVRRVDVADLEPMRQRGSIAPGTVVLLIHLVFDEAMRAEWGSRPETVCGPFGCYTTRRNYAYDIPTSRAHLEVKMYDGPSARVLDEVVLLQHDEGLEYTEMRDRISHALADRLERLVDQREAAVEVELYDVEDLPAAARALSAIERGDWTEGRHVLEEARRSTRNLPREARARYYYDLSLAQRFDPTTLSEPDAHFVNAERSLQHAIALDGDEDRYRAALSSLRAHRNEVLRVVAQHRARDENFASARAASNVPQPPASYQRSLPEDGPQGMPD